ncbi:MAG: hypothetical protein AB8I08_35950 [Sandaracinaceae bacterium]
MNTGLHAIALLVCLAVGSSVAHAQDETSDATEETTAEVEVEVTEAHADPIAPPSPSCAEGREATPRSGGRCCWPGQGWNEQYGRCSGPPVCPANLVADGDDCIAPAAPAPVAVVPPSTAAVVVTPEGRAPVSWESFEDERPRGGLAPELTYTADEGWMIFGGVAFGAGWAFSIVIGSIGGLASDVCSDLGGYAFIPVVGGLVHAATLDRCNDTRADAGAFWGPYATSSAAQLAGIIAFVAAVITEDAEALEFQSLTFSVPGADIGVGYQAQF